MEPTLCIEQIQHIFDWHDWRYSVDDRTLQTRFGDVGFEFDVTGPFLGWKAELDLDVAADDALGLVNDVAKRSNGPRCTVDGNHLRYDGRLALPRAPTQVVGMLVEQAIVEALDFTRTLCEAAEALRHATSDQGLQALGIGVDQPEGRT